MATIKLKFRPSSSPQKEGSIFFQVIHKRVTRQIHTGYKIFPEEWDRQNNEIIICSDTRRRERGFLLQSLNTSINNDLKRLRSVISYLERTKNDYTAEEVVSCYLSPVHKPDFISFARHLIGRLNFIGKQSTVDNYTTALNSFIRFRGEHDVPLDDMDTALMTAYESYLKAARICPNSISFYMRNLRAIYNRAVEQDLTVQRHPFRHVYTGIDKTRKRAVGLDIIRRIKDLDLSAKPPLDFARDIFMFSFYTRGMAFVDMAFLKKHDLKNGILSYRRQKTGQQLLIKWEKPMHEMIEKYDTGNSSYLLPIIRNNGTDERRQYKKEIHRINRSLRKIGELLDLCFPLTTYVARHSWANIAKTKNIPIATISEAMGHDSETTTRIYLASLDTSIVDKANSLILKSL